MADREKLLDLLQECDVICKNTKCCECEYNQKSVCKAQLKADHLIANGVAVQEWIPATERLPEENTYVLMCASTGSIMKGSYDHQWNHWNCFRTITITHWMPLPEPPKGE